MNVVSLPQKPTSSMPAASAQLLRDLADQIEAGEIEEMVIGVGFGEERYSSYFLAGPRDSLALATVLQQHAIARVQSGD